MTNSLSRREVIVGLGATGLALPLLSADDKTSANTSSSNTLKSSKKLRHASIGVGGMGGSDIGQIYGDGSKVEIIAICDVDKNTLNGAQKRFPKARAYADWRELLEKEKGNIDSINVATPDHMHAPIAMTALQQGLHIYGQKPLTHTIWESRRLTEMAAKMGVVTQMGIQCHATSAYRMGMAYIRAGLVGRIKEVHSWEGKDWYGKAGTLEKRPGEDKTSPIPDNLNWDLWLGVAPERPFVKQQYHAVEWRRWQDFGCGTLGDMAVHIYDPVKGALNLKYPTSVLSYQTPPFAETWAPDNKIRFTFPKTDYTVDTLNWWWYDVKMKPDCTTLGVPPGTQLPGAGSLFVGEEGSVILPHPGAPQPLPREKFAEKMVEFKTKLSAEIAPYNHYQEFVDACLGKGNTKCNFDYSGPLTETILLGLIAHRFQNKELIWDGPALQFTNMPEANQYIKNTPYRKGWEVPGLS